MDSTKYKFLKRASQSEGKRTPTLTKYLESKTLQIETRRVLCTIEHSKIGKDSIITLSSEFFWNGETDFLLDTGSDLNLIKEETFNNKILINSRKIFNLIGIGR